MLISYLSKFAPRKNKTVAVINNVVLLTHWQITMRNINNGVLEAKRRCWIEENCNSKPSVKQVFFQTNHLRIHLVSRPFNLFENTSGTSACGEDKHRRVFDDIFPLCGFLWFPVSLSLRRFDQNPINGSKKKQGACHNFEPRSVYFRSRSQWHQCRLHWLKEL